MSRDTRFLKKERLDDFLAGVLRDRRVFAPVKRSGVLLLDRIESAGECALERGHTKNSAKEVFFPQVETLFTYRRTEAGPEIDEVASKEKPAVLFGVRPCDARGLVLLDRVFTGGTQDPYYAGKRAESLVIAMACDSPDPTCFCSASGGGPCSSEGSDLLFLDLDVGFLVKAESRKGVELLRDAAFEDARDEALAAAGLVEKEAEDSMDRAALGETAVGEALAKHLERLFDHPVWNDVAEACLGCGVCTYLCPTCHCFDICDETGPGTGERIRIWDSCQFPLFTRQASGANPRPSVRERFRQRTMHKFCYLPRNVNFTGCVGCGRCVTECPRRRRLRPTRRA